MKSLYQMLVDGNAQDGDEYTDIRGHGWAFRNSPSQGYVLENPNTVLCGLDAVSCEGWTRVTTPRVKVEPLVLKGWIVRHGLEAYLTFGNFPAHSEEPAYDEHGKQLEKHVYVKKGSV